VSDYRIYVLDREGRINSPPEIAICATDEEAMARAREILTSLPVEVWLGPKRVGRLDPDKP
jgi:hypothetical protein